MPSRPLRWSLRTPCRVSFRPFLLEVDGVVAVEQSEVRTRPSLLEANRVVAGARPRVCGGSLGHRGCAFGVCFAGPVYAAQIGIRAWGRGWARECCAR